MAFVGHEHGTVAAWQYEGYEIEIVWDAGVIKEVYVIRPTGEQTLLAAVNMSHEFMEFVEQVLRYATVPDFRTPRHIGCCGSSIRHQRSTPGGTVETFRHMLPGGRDQCIHARRVMNYEEFIGISSAVAIGGG